MLPSNLHYTNKLESAYARSYTTHIQPQNNGHDYTAGQTIMLNIPTTANLVLASTESVFKFDLSVTNGTAESAFIRLDKAGAHGVIQRLRLYNGSQLLEDLDNYGNLVAQLSVLQKSSACNGKDSILEGFCNDKFCDTNAVDAPDALTKTNQVFPIVAGERLIPDVPHVDGTADSTEFTKFIANRVSKTRTYCINLLSIVGSLSDKYVPLFAMTSSSLRLELQLVSSPDKFACSEKAMAGFTINNCEYIAQMMELGDSAMSIVNANIGGKPLQWVVPSYRNYVYNTKVMTETFQASIPVPAKFNSLKSMFMTMRQHSNGALTHFPFGSCRFGLSEYTIRLGSRVIPSKAPQNAPEFFVELLKSIGSVSDINHEPMIDLDNYDYNISKANTETGTHISATSSCPSFMIGVDLETYSNADKSSIFAGYNSSNEDVFFQMGFQGLATDTDVRFDTYALYDAVIICENGIAMTRY